LTYSLNIFFNRRAVFNRQRVLLDELAGLLELQQATAKPNLQWTPFAGEPLACLHDVPCAPTMYVIS
jgi:hypothetical protein